MICKSQKLKLKELVKVTPFAFFSSWFAVISAPAAMMLGNVHGTSEDNKMLSPHHFSAVSTAKLIFQFLLCGIWLTEQRCGGQLSPGEEVGTVGGGENR